MKDFLLSEWFHRLVVRLKLRGVFRCARIAEKKLLNGLGSCPNGVGVLVFLMVAKKIVCSLLEHSKVIATEDDVRMAKMVYSVWRKNRW